MNFLHKLSQLLSKLDSAYFTTMDIEVVLNTIPDKECAAFLERPEEAADKVQQRVSSDSIPTGPEVTSKMCLQKTITPFDKKGQEAVTKLFGHLQDAHNHMAEVAKAVVDLSKVSSPDQCKQLFAVNCGLLVFLFLHWFSCSFVSEVCTGLGNGCERFAHRDLC